MKRYVVDASVAVKWLIPEEHSEQAMKLLEDWFKEDMELNAPSWLKLEVTNALTKYVKRQIIDAEKAHEGFEIFRSIELNYVEEDWPLIDDALKSSTSIGLSMYDAIYYTLARRMKATLITADVEFINKVKADISVEDVRDRPLNG